MEISKQRTQQKKALVIGTVWPEPISSAAGVRTIGLIEALRDLGWVVTMASSAKNTEFRDRIADLGFAVESIEMNHSSFDEFLAREKFDLAVFDRFLVEEQFGARVEKTLPQCLRILDTIDLHFLRRTRELRIRGKITPSEIDQDTCLRELASIYRSDLSLLLSSQESVILHQEFAVPESLTAEWGFCYRVPNRDELPAFQARSPHLAWIGNFRHAPNEDAVKWCLREFLPAHWDQIRAQVPEAEIHFYGAYPPKELMALDQPKRGIRVLGPCEDAIEMLKKYRVMFAPIRFGAGIKGKISDSWAAGLPVVTTPVGAEGMIEPGQPFAGEVVESPESMRDAVIQVLQDESGFALRQERGIRALDALYAVQRQQKRFGEILERLESRERPWIQKILWHQNHRSTDFFSRWIEEKEAK